MTIYYQCLDDARPSGGRRVAYRHVDILNSNGYDAAIMHMRPKFRLDWFDNDTKVVSAHETGLKPDDILVIPETRGPKLHEQAMGRKFVIFNQGVYQTFINYNGDEQTTPYHHPDLLGVMCVSKNSEDYLRFAFPDLKSLKRVHISIDDNLFQHVKVADKKRQIAFMSRKHIEDVVQVVNMLKFRNALDWKMVLIDGVPETEVARIMSESAIYLEFGYPAGCPVPPLEALSSGCYVIGYTGFGADEYAYHASNLSIIRHADTLTFAKTIENVCQWFDEIWSNEGLLKITEMKSKRDADYINQNYNRDVEIKDVLDFWNGILE